MKLDIEVTLKNDKLAKFDIFETLTVSIDKDYIDDIEDVYCQISDFIWENYGEVMNVNEDFELSDDVIDTINDEVFN
jgi:hypothetical protein